MSYISLRVGLVGRSPKIYLISIYQSSYQILFEFIKFQKTENPLKCVYKNLHLSEILEENGGNFQLVRYKSKCLMTMKLFTQLGSS